MTRTNIKTVVLFIKTENTGVAELVGMMEFNLRKNEFKAPTSRLTQ